MRRVLDLLLLGALATSSWHRIAWTPLGRLTLADVFAFAFIALFAVDRVARRDGALHPAVATTLLCTAALVAGYLVGFQNIDTTTGATQWAKGMGTTVPRLLLLLAMAAHLARGGRRLYVRALVVYVAGMAFNAVYGVAQEGAQLALGLNIDEHLVNPYFPGAVANGANYYGQVSSVDANGAIVRSAVYRMTGLTNDPNHLGILLATIVVLVGAAALGASARRRAPLLGLSALLLVAAALTQSRSAALGLLAGGVVVAIGARRQLVTRSLAAPAAVLGAALAAVLLAERGYVRSVIEARLQTSSSGSSVHTQVYGLIGTVLSQHPLFGLGLNTFTLLYALEDDRTNFGPHSVYVELMTETGLVGTALYALLVGSVVAGLIRLRRRARAGGDELAAGIALGLMGAIVTTLAANAFYLTTVFPYWFELLAFGVAAAPALGLEARRATTRALAAPATEPR